MAVLHRSRRLQRKLGLLSVYALAIGTTLSSGLFLLPGLAFSVAGPAVILSYVLSTLPLIPAMLCIVELATATPRAGGTYYFLDRSMGAAVGTIGGIGTWLALVLKTAFALVGMGAYVGLFAPNVPLKALAVAVALGFGILNLVGAKVTGYLQVVLVTGVLIALSWFLIRGLPEVQVDRFQGFWDVGFDKVLASSAMVFVSFVGVTTVASISEEVKDPERVLPLGIFMAVGTAIAIYVLGIMVMVGVIPQKSFVGDLTPVATAASLFSGRAGQIGVSVAAILAFSSVANSGILSASRYPLAMSRDHLLPRALGRMGRDGIPRIAVLVTLGLVIVCVVLFDPTRIAKLASAFQLLMFAGICAAVLVMRESRIESYDPSFRSPFYPYMQIFGILSALFLLAQMGWQSQLFTFGIVLLCLVWYLSYARPRIIRSGAVVHVFARLGQERTNALDIELRGILKEKGMRAHDPFEEIVAHASVIDVREVVTFDEVTDLAAGELARHVPESRETIVERFLEGTRIGATPVAKGVALPHLRHSSLQHPHMVVLRVLSGVIVPVSELTLGSHAEDETIHALVYLASPEEDPAQHLRILAQLARCAEDPSFMNDWLSAKSEHELRLMLLREERMLQITVEADGALSNWVGQTRSQIALPDGCLLALLRHGDHVEVPTPHTVIQDGDCLTLIGEPAALAVVASRNSSNAGESSN